MLLQTVLQESKGRKAIYEPKLNDRVRFDDHEGWVYCITDEYFTLEIATKPKDDDLVSMHKKHHVLLVVYNNRYDEVEYIGHRDSIYHDTINQTQLVHLH